MKAKILAFAENIGTYILIGLMTLGLTVVYAVARAQTFNNTFFLAGLALMLIPGIVLYMMHRSSVSNDNKAIISYRDEIKKNGLSVPVNLSECEIKANSWVQEQERYINPKIQALNAIGGDTDKNVKKIFFASAIVLYKHRLNGRTYTFKSDPIAKDKATLSMLLAHQAVTSIYVNKRNPKQYYFDLEFLDNP